MSKSLNRVYLIGRLGQDPELRYTREGTAVCTMSVATDESYKDRAGNQVDQTEWHRVVVFGRPAEAAANALLKGGLVLVEGKLQTRKWQDRDGASRTTTEILASNVQFLERGPERELDAPPREAPNPPSGPPPREQGQGSLGGGQAHEEDLGPAFPTEASGMDDVPF